MVCLDMQRLNTRKLGVWVNSPDCEVAQRVALAGGSETNQNRVVVDHAALDAYEATVPEPTRGEALMGYVLSGVLDADVRIAAASDDITTIY